MSQMKVVHSIIINLPAEEVFAYVSEFENLASWSGAVTAVQKTSTGERLIGTSVRCTVGMLGRCFETTYEIVECMPGRTLTFKSIRSMAPTLVCYDFKPIDDSATTFTVEETINFTGGFLDYDEQAVKKTVLNQIASDLQTLKDLLEIKLSSSP